MDLNELQLPAALVTELYGHSLVEAANNLPGVTGSIRTTPAPKTSGYRSLGSNQKNILVLVQTANAVHVEDESLAFLTNMLGACQLSMADVALVNLESQEKDYKALLETFKSRIALLFGIEPAAVGLPMSFPHFQIQPFAGCSFLYAPALDIIEKDKVEKSKLWVSLRRLFNI